MSTGSSFGHRQWALALFAVAVLLVGGGVVIVVVDAGEPSQRYARVNVSVEDPGAPFVTPDSVAVQGDIFGIDCYFFEISRECMLERTLLRSPESSVVVPYRGASAETFVQVGRAFYRRTRERVNDTHYRHGLERVRASVVAANVSVPVSEVGDPGRRVIEQGTVRLPVDADPATDLLVDTGDGYATVERVDGSYRTGLPPVEGPMVLVGLLAFWRGGVHVRRR